MLSAARTSVRRRRLAGLLILVVTPLLVVLATFRPEVGTSGRTVRVVVDEAKGLAKVERDVRIHGVNVGTVGEVRRAGTGAELTLRLRDDAGPLYADARAALRPHSVFEGSAFVELDPGTPAAGPLRGATIPRTRSTVYVSVDQALRGLDAERRADLQEITAELSGAMNDETAAANRRTLGTLPALTRDAGAVARAVRGPGDPELHAAIRDLQAATGTVAQRAGDLGPLARDTDRTLAALASPGTAALDRALARLPVALATTRTAAADASALSAELRRTATRLRPVLAEATPAIAALTPTARRVVPVLRQAPELTDALRLTLADLQRAAVPLQQLLDPVAPAVRDLKLRALPAIRAESRLGQPAYRQFFAAGTGLTGALSHYQTKTQSPAGPGHFVKTSGDVANGLLGTLMTPPELTP